MSKHTSLFFLGLIAAGSAYAQSEEVRWDKLCLVASNHEIVVKTQTGETVVGFCERVTGEELTVSRRGQSAVKVARSALAKIEMRPAKGGQLKKLRRDFRHAMGASAGLLFTSAGVAGVVAVPVVAAWGVTALPFCALGDLAAKLSTPIELRPI